MRPHAVTILMATTTAANQSTSQLCNIIATTTHIYLHCVGEIVVKCWITHAARNCGLSHAPHSLISHFRFLFATLIPYSHSSFCSQQAVCCCCTICSIALLTLINIYSKLVNAGGRLTSWNFAILGAWSHRKALSYSVFCNEYSRETSIW